MIDILFFLLVGIAFGITFGLVPGLHPNTLILAVPLLAALSLDPLQLIALVVGMAVANSITDFIPSIVLGAPDGDNALSVLPGHQMLMKGYGYQAIKLTVIGGLISIIIALLFMPVMIITVPFLFSLLRPYTHLLLIFIVAFIVLGEYGNKKFFSLMFFLAAGIVGLLLPMLPIDNSTALFPVLAGLFGISSLFMQIKTGGKIPKQKKGEYYVSRRIIGQSSILGTFGGILSGLLPGVGSSSIAALASTSKEKESFLVSIGAITTANMLISMLSLWLISRPRSGAAIMIDQLTGVGFIEFVFILLFAAISAGIAAIGTLKLAKGFLSCAENVNYRNLSYLVIIFIVAATAAFSGLWGVLLLGVSSALGTAAQLVGVRRGILMGVLIFPTIIFFSPI